MSDEFINDRRPWPLPADTWVMFQRWDRLLFAHWPVPYEALRPLVPESLPLDQFDGSAWIGIVPFEVTGAYIRGLRGLPLASDFPEINVRTYVTVQDKPGVYFFSLDAGSALAVAGARLLFRLPYFYSKLRIGAEGATVKYESERDHPDAPNASFTASYRPVGDVFEAAPGSIEYFFVERYCLYTVDRLKRIYRAEIQHRPWPLQPAEAEIERNTMAAAAGVTLPDAAPLLSYAQSQPTRIWPLRRA